MNTVAHWIGGEPRTSASQAVFDDVAPATGLVVARVSRGDAADVEAAVDAAQAALDGDWGAMTRLQRADVLDRIADGLEGRLDELAQLESEDTGKPISLARRIDIPRAVSNFRFFAGAIRHTETPCHQMASALNYTIRKPLGIVGLITPWNLPLYLLTWKAAPALAMGNAIIAKPSELTPRTASVLAEITAEAGLPAGAFNLVHGFGPEAGQAIVSHPAIRGVSFTGGTSTGARVGETAAPHFKKVSLELGGKNATVVFEDADFDAAVAGAVRAGFTNQGQVCLCGSRLLVHRSIYAAFVDAFVARVRDQRVGDPSDPDTAVGSLVSAAHRDKVESYIALAREEGGTIACGGDRPALPGALAQGAFVNPTVVTGLSPSCRSATEEVFGPMVTVHPFDTEAEALAIANSVRYGLSASVWTRDLRRAHRVAESLEAGMVWVNTWLKRDLRVPFGGVKDSGVGREGGAWSLGFFSEAINICIDLTETS
jgi:aminomuconate-semialdehyde/2-hydroxymuconate-6-semialdehyde dehydrogenase